jgi:two-component system, LuxR family, sensor kinase FixL
VTRDNEERRLRSVALQNAESIRVLRLRAEQQTEAALREQASLLNLTHDAIFVRDMNGTVKYWNRGAEELYGWSAEQAVGRVILELLNTIFEVPLERIEEEVIEAGRWEGELVQTKKDGSQVVVASRWSLQRDESSAPVAMLVINNDITERKRAEAEAHEKDQRYRDMQVALAHANRVATMGQLTASIAHEVNQPLAAVVNAAGACRRWLDGDTLNLDEARLALDWIVREGNRASEVIRRVRALANKTEIEKLPLDVNGVVRETIGLTQREIFSHQVSLRMELAPALPTILGDRIQLQQVVINLVMNGIEAMQSVTDRPRELVIRSCQDEKQQVLTSVTDCGAGIAAESTDRLFVPFFTTKSGGMGMGLSICRSIIEAHGGRLWATANTPHGATFQFTLPVNADTARLHCAR